MEELLNKINLLLQEESIIKREKKKRGEYFNVFEIMHAQSDEVHTHSAIIAALLNPKGIHGCRSAFLSLFMEKLSDLLQKDLKRFNNSQNYSSYWIRKGWYHWKYVLTNYTRQRGYYESNSFIIGDSNFEHFISLLQHLSKECEITDFNDNPLTEFIRGLRVRFKYRSLKFIYFKENDTYKICRIAEDGHKLKKEDDSLYE